MGGLLAQDLKLINDLDNSDTEDDYTQFKPVLSRPEEAFIKAKKSELRTGTDYFESPANQEVYRSLMKLTPEQLKEQAVSTAKDVADVTPLIGEIKALSELPSNLAYASELVKLGYDENDLVTMGLGGAYSILAAMGVIPGVRLGAKVAKKAIKKNFGEIMDEELAKGATKDTKPVPPVVDEPPKKEPEPISAEEFLEEREKRGLMSKR